MAIDPEIQAVLDRVNALPAIDYSSVDPLQLAKQLRAATPPLPKFPSLVARIENKTIAGPGGDIPIRIYWPSGTGPFAAVANFHGGGWVMGAIDNDEWKCHALVNTAGCAIVSAHYRLAPEHPYPAAVEDAYAVTEWLERNAASLGCDSSRIGVVGSSAGGNLAAVVAMIARDRGGPALKSQALIYPVCDDDFDRRSYIDNGTGKFLTRSQMKWFWDQYAGRASRNDPYLRPMYATNLDGLPPAVIVTGEHDPLRDEGAAYAQRLANAGIDVSYDCFAGMVHGFLTFATTHLKSLEAIEFVGRAMKKHLAAKSPS